MQHRTFSEKNILENIFGIKKYYLLLDQLSWV